LRGNRSGWKTLSRTLSIEDDFDYLGEHIHIWYDPDTLQTTQYIRENTKEYRPDFLIRDKLKGDAWLVEIKPMNVNCEQQLLVRTQVAEHYIHQHSPDWKFIILYDQKIFLSPDQEKKFAF